MSASATPLFEAESAFFADHVATWVAQGHEGRFAVIKGARLVLMRDTLLTAYEAAVAALGVTEGFMLKAVSAAPEVPVTITRLMYPGA